MRLKEARERVVGNEVIKVGKGQVMKGFVNQVEFGFDFTCNKNLLKCSEERLYMTLFTLLK